MIFGVKVTEFKTCVLIFSAMFEIVPIPRGIRRNTIINLHTSQSVVPTILSDFNQTWIFATRFSKNTQLPNFVKIRPLGNELFRADKRTGRHDDGSSSVFAICNRAYKWYGRCDTDTILRRATEQITSAINHSVASSWFSSLRIYSYARTNIHHITAGQVNHILLSCIVDVPSPPSLFSAKNIKWPREVALFRNAATVSVRTTHVPSFKLQMPDNTRFC